MTDLLFGDGVISELATVIDGQHGPVAVVTGSRSYEESGASPWVERALEGRSWRRVVVEHRLPGAESAGSGLEAMQGFDPGLVVAVGGGTVIDTAKLICLALANGGVEELFAGDRFRPAVPLIAVPTTAGSGAERTPFAVAYLGAEKHSIGHESLAPVAAIVDPGLTHSAPRDLTIATGLDALSHAIESLWSTQATADSRELSRRALYLAWNTISIVAEDPGRASRSLMAEAATTAGAAIATARTTASHALSYHLTWHYGVPHGPAVALTLAPLIEVNGEVVPESTTHPGGPGAVRDLVAEIAGMMGAEDGAGGRAALQARMQDLRAPTTLSDIGLTSEEQVDALVASVNRERLANNPRRLGETDLRRLLEQIR